MGPLEVACFFSKRFRSEVEASPQNIMASISQKAFPFGKEELNLHGSLPAAVFRIPP